MSEEQPETPQETSEHRSLPQVRTWSQYEGQRSRDEDERKRRKVTRACDACKSKKKRCTGDLPCATCRRLRATCTYNATYNRGVAGPPSPAISAPPHTEAAIPAAAQSGGSRVSRRSESELGIAASLASLSAPRHRIDADTPASHSGQASAEPEEATPTAGQYHGPTSAHFFLGRAWRPLDQTASSAPTPQQHDEDSGVSIFAYGDRKFAQAGEPRIKWPSPAATREMLRIYFEYASPTYRVLHRATTARWVSQMHQQQESGEKPALSIATQALVWLVFATSSMFRVDDDGETQDADEAGWRDSELYYTEAERLLSRETGAPSLESVQARFLVVLWLLSTSRMNKAWFVHGTMTQLILALGLHRTRLQQNAPLPDALAPDEIRRECQKRTLWCAYTLDKYISLILGRPRHLRLEDIDQELPAHVNDEDLTAKAILPSSGKDCVQTAQIVSALLAQILARSFRDQYTIKGITDRQQIEYSLQRIEEIVAWHATLPPFLSGVIHASSLNPLFRRQCRAVRIAHAHAVMSVTRPLLLRNYSQILPEYDGVYREQIRRCLVAAKDAIEIVGGIMAPLFRPFWHSQYAIFNALSIIYIYLIQTRKRRIPGDLLLRNKSSASATAMQSPELDEDELFVLAEASQLQLAKATARNAPTWRYSVILEGLRNEVSRLMRSPPQKNVQDDPRDMEPNNQARPRSTFIDTVLHSSSDQSPASSSAQQPQPISLGGARPSAATGTNQMTLQQTQPTAEHTPTGQSYSEMAEMGGHNLWGVGMGDFDFSLDFWPQLDSLPLCESFQ